MKTRRTKTGNDRGFTLIEMMITAVIIGVVASLAVPSFQRVYDRHSFKTGQEMVTSTLKKARSTAISTKVPCGVYINAAARSITLFENKNNSSVASFDDGDSTLSVDTLPDQFEYLDGDMPNSAIVFRPNGSAQLTGYGNIFLTGETDGMMAYYSINVLASTGRINVYSHYYNW